MAIAVDASSPARVTATTTAATTAAFSPPAGLLVVCTSASASSGLNPTIAITNTVASLSWTQIGSATRSSTGSTAVDGCATMHVAVLSSPATGMTVTATQTSGSTPTSIKVYVITGAATSSVYANATIGFSTANQLNTTAFTSQSASSLFMVSATEWTAPGTAPTSADTTADTYTQSTNLDGLSGYRAITAAGASQVCDLNCSGTAAAEWLYVTVEILPASTGGSGGGGPFAVDASSPALALAAGAATATTAAFSPPACVLVACMFGNDAGTAATFSAPTNTGPVLTWTQAVVRNRSSTGGQGGNASVWYAVLSSAASGMTVTAHYSSTDVGLKVYAVTGADTSPAGATQNGSFTAAASGTTAGMTTQGGNSLGFVIANDFTGADTPPTSTDATYVNGALSNRDSGLTGFKTLGAVGSSATFALAFGSSTAAINYVCFEVLALKTAIRRLMVRSQAANRASTY